VEVVDWALLVCILLEADVEERRLLWKGRLVVLADVTEEGEEALKDGLKDRGVGTTTMSEAEEEDAVDHIDRPEGILVK
jgi:hypothetical protein